MENNLSRFDRRDMAESDWMTLFCDTYTGTEIIIHSYPNLRNKEIDIQKIGYVLEVKDKNVMNIYYKGADSEIELVLSIELFDERVEIPFAHKDYHDDLGDIILTVLEENSKDLRLIYRTI